MKSRPGHNAVKENLALARSALTSDIDNPKLVTKAS